MSHATAMLSGLSESGLPTVFALLDDAQASAERPGSRLYTGFVREHRCTDPVTLAAVCTAVDRDLRGLDGPPLHAVLLADYEWGTRLLGAGARASTDGKADGALRLLMFRDCRHLDAAGVADWLAEADGSAQPGPAGVRDWRANVDEAAFTTAIEQVREWIRAGETYQINYTYRLHGEAWGTPLALYRRLRERQPVAYGALIALPPEVETDPGRGHEGAADRQRWVLSCSPELFVRHTAGTLTTRPMKGTAPRAASAEGDSAMASWLADDVKNRAENLMIVDLLRNDLGRISRTGSVRVPQLFALEPYRTVFQMTSTVEAALPPATDLPAVLRALFPCGSITGAPKHHTMDLIARLEPAPRGLYTGAIGWLDAPAADRALGDFCWSVAIRTLVLAPPVADTLGGVGEVRPAVLGIGAGIVLDSEPADEYAECRLKGRFVTQLDPGFTLFETMRCEDGRLQRLDVHLARLADSARALGFRVDPPTWRAELAAALQSRPPAPDAVERWRLDLAFDGRTMLQRSPLLPLPPGPVSLQWAEAPLPAEERRLLRHKTSLRTAYDVALQAAIGAGAFDRIYLNERGELTEGARSSVFVKIGGCWFTPPLDSGVLAGVTRAAVLADPRWAAEERVLTRALWEQAQDWMVCNALRGCLPARPPQYPGS